LFSEEQKKERILKIHPGKERQNLEKWDEKKEKKSVFVKKEQISLYFSLFLSSFFILFLRRRTKEIFFLFLAFC